MVQNPPSSLNFLKAKGKWYVYVTIPPELRSAFKDQVQLRRSTGTSDKTIAKARQHGIATEIYAEPSLMIRRPLAGLPDFFGKCRT